MSKTVTFFNESGQPDTAVTDPETARAFGTYNRVYRNAAQFTVAHEIQPSRYAHLNMGYICDVIVATSTKMKITIVCFKDFIPDVPEDILDHASYECGIIDQKTNRVKRVFGGIEPLYYNLFHKRVKE